jgi:hypothetical protein
MTWIFDQAPNVACIADRSVMSGRPVLVVAHYEDDHSWAFLDGGPFDPADALVVAMSEVVERHPELVEIAELPAGWSASRSAVGQPWETRKDEQA